MNIYSSYSNVRQRGVSISNMSSGNLEVCHIYYDFNLYKLFDRCYKKGTATNKPSYICAYLFLLTTMIR